MVALVEEMRAVYLEAAKDQVRMCVGEIREGEI
jgi:hypothetical protein